MGPPQVCPSRAHPTVRTPERAAGSQQRRRLLLPGGQHDPVAPVLDPGLEGGSYYADERKLTLDNVKAVKRCITASEESGIDAVGEIVAIGTSGRAPKPGRVLWAR